MPFGISVAPEEFECKLQEKLSDLEGTHVLRDDILVVGYGDTIEEAEKNHDENLRKVLNRARQVNLKLNSKKMSLKKTEVKFTGHVISRDGLKPDPDKVKAVKDMPKPTCKQETLSLLGFINYLAKFLPRLSETAQPLRDLTVKNAKFTWAKQHDKAFAEIKQLVISHPVLRYYDVNEEVTLQCDASERGLGAVLLQNGQPVAFASRTLTETEQRYAQIEKECLSITFGAHKFSQYISRREKVTVETDHKPLESIFRKSLLDAPSRLQRMLLRLQRYNLEVGYKPGPQMFIADHLSRASIRETGPQDEEFQVFAVEVEGMGPLNSVKISSERLAQLQKATEQDPIMQTLKTTILVGWPEHREQTPVHIREYWNYREELTLHNGVLFKNQKVIIPKAMRPEMISRIHSSHLGIETCLRKARDLVFWPSMNSEIKEAVIKCSVCAEYQAKNPKQPMQTHSIPDRPWSKVGTDLKTSFEKNCFSAWASTLNMGLIGKGLNFVPLTKKTDEFTVKEDTEKFLRRVKLKAHFHDKEQPSDEPQRDEFESLKPKKSNWTPPDGQFTSVDLFVKKCRVDIQKLNFNKSLKFSNLSKEEWTAHQNLKTRDDIVIKPADKGGAVVVWRTDLYKQEAFRQLADTKFYAKVNKDLTQANQKIVKDTVNKLILQQKLPSTARNLFVTTPKTSTFYLKPKIHKPNNPGRPIISACSCPTELISSFLDKKMARKRKEQRLIFKLGTLAPNGINERFSFA